MKKLLFALFALFFVRAFARAFDPEDFNYPPISSYTDTSTGGTVLFTSAAIVWDGVTIGSPAAGSFLAIYRSTSPQWDNNLSTETFVSLDYVGLNGGPTFLDFLDMKNTSYTYINKNGGAKITMWFRCPHQNLKSNEPYSGLCPGLGPNGR